MRSVNMAHGTLFLVGAYAGVAVFYPLYDDGNAYARFVALAVRIGDSWRLSAGCLSWLDAGPGAAPDASDDRNLHHRRGSAPGDFGGLSQQFYAPDILFGSVPVPFVQGGQYSTFRLFQVVVAIGIGLGLWLILQRTKLGIVARAGVDDRAMLSAQGINVPLVGNSSAGVTGCLSR